MYRSFVALLLCLAGAAQAHAHGLLIPTEKAVPPLAMLNHLVDVAIDDQVALTRVEQTFRNHLDRKLEATYIFPVPRGASVRKFSMWVGGKEVPGEMVEADMARQVFTSIVQRTLDPGLLEYVGGKLFRMKVAVAAGADLKVAVSFTGVVPRTDGLVEYTYPLKTDGVATATLEKFDLTLQLKSQQPLQTIYSPTHAIAVTRSDDRTARVVFAKDQALLDRDFQLFYATGGKDVGLTALTHRPVAGKEGHFLLLISPRAELSKEQQVPRDMVFVLDTSGSMQGRRIAQAKSALQYCLRNLQEGDRFGLLTFATTVNHYSEQLLPANQAERERARQWVDQLDATGATALNAALSAALALRSSDMTRPFTVIFFTDGQPTIGETSPVKILQNVAAKNTANTRIFTFGVGDDVNASLLDALAGQSRAVSTYVRENEDIEAKVSSLYGKISNPILTNLKLSVGPDVKLSEVYPPQLPDLFHGNQLVVLGRYSGHGPAAVKLTGSVGKESRTFTYETNFPEKTAEQQSFVEDLWARRKVGYLLDEIRRLGPNKELVETVVTLAKRYGITTPYTSYLIVPDAPVPVAAGAVRTQDGKPDVSFRLNNGGQPGSPANVPNWNAPNFNGGGFQIGGGGFQIGGNFNFSGQFGGGFNFSGQFQGAGFQIGGGGFQIQGGQASAYRKFMPAKIQGGGFQAGGGFQVGGGGFQVGGGGFNTGGGFNRPGGGGQVPIAQSGAASGGKPSTRPASTGTTPPPANQPPNLKEFVDQVQPNPGDGANARLSLTQDVLNNIAGFKSNAAVLDSALEQGQQRWAVNGQAGSALQKGRKEEVQVGKLGVELSIDSGRLRDQERLMPTAVKRVQGRSCIEVAGVWLDEGYHPKMKTVTVKAMSPAYFRILERHDSVREVYRLGIYLVWVTPANTALIVDAGTGRETMTDSEIDALFAVPK